MATNRERIKALEAEVASLEARLAAIEGALKVTGAVVTLKAQAVDIVATEAATISGGKFLTITGGLVKIN